MQILVITPVKYPAPYLQEAITSVYQNKGPFFVKHLIIYQGVKQSGLQRTVGENYLLEYLHSDGHGVSQNRNLGLTHCIDFDIVAFLDADDMWAPDIIASAINQLVNGIDVVSFYGVPMTSRQTIFNVTTPFVGDQILSGQQKVLNYIGCPSGVFFRRSVFSIKFNEALNHYEDYLFYLQNFQTSVVKKSSASFFYYRLHDEQATKTSLRENIVRRNDDLQKISDNSDLELPKRIRKMHRLFLSKELKINKLNRTFAFFVIFLTYPPYIIHQMLRFKRF